ncbi:MAG: hypothetical protein ABI760_22155 [Ferruginibacter sp.]
MKIENFSTGAQIRFIFKRADAGNTGHISMCQIPGNKTEATSQAITTTS